MGRRSKILELRISNTSFRPTAPIITCPYDLYDAVDEKMWIGFSGGIGDQWSVYYMYNWTFTSFGISPDFPPGDTKLVSLIAGICGGVFLALLCIAVGVCVYLWRRRALQESWDKEGLMDMPGMPEFISYKHLSAATKQFSDQSKLGQGGFGSVYQGVLPKTGARVAVKKVSSDSRQGEREFLAEVQIISQLRHRNVVELTGFCRDRGKFLLVYELLPNGSLDQALFKPKSPLPWSQRWKIVAGAAAALHYLHEGWRQQVIHRDVKSSNIMLDEEYNAKLGDFGLARLVDHSKNATTTMVAGTYGYIAPEAVGGRFTDKTDVFAFGAVALEVACGRRAYDSSVTSEEELILVGTVWRHWKEGTLLSMADHRLQGDFDQDEMCTVLKLGLLCSHPEAAARPSMRQVVQVLAGEAEVPEVPEAMPDASLADDMPKISIDDLLNSSGSRSGFQSRSRSGRGKRPVSISLTSMPSSSSQASGSSHSFGSRLNPR
jgi:serine/threonine protein kinase